MSRAKGDIKYNDLYVDKLSSFYLTNIVFVKLFIIRPNEHQAKRQKNV